jgi:multimeric flavodoxin WrbA
MLKLIAVNGSPRRHGNTADLVERALVAARAQGIETEGIFLGDYRIAPCLGHPNCTSLASCTQADDAARITDKLAAADGVILACPSITTA